MKFIMLFINKITFFMAPLVAIGTKNSMIVIVDIFAARNAGNLNVLIITFVYHITK